MIHTGRCLAVAPRFLRSGPGNARRCHQWSVLLKKVLYFAFALMALPRLYDFVFHAGHVHDLVAAAGFAVLLVGCLWDERARRACPPVARLRYRANAAATCGAVVVLVALLMERKVFG